MSGDGVYLQEDGESIMMWIGKAASPQLLHSLFNIPSLDQLRVEMGEGCLVRDSPDDTCKLPMSPMLIRRDQPDGHRVVSIIDQLRLDRSPPMMQLILVPQGNQNEVRFFSNLIEDKTIGMQMSYQEFLHRIGGANQPRGPIFAGVPARAAAGTPQNSGLAPQAMMPGGPQMPVPQGGAPLPPPPAGMYGSEQPKNPQMPTMQPMGQAPPPPMGSHMPSGPPPMGQPPMGQPPMGQPPMGQPPMGPPPMGPPPMGNTYR
ncbi:hypothetical protein FOZ62_030569 [Perkinsus olseni]|uniref:Protein transport protein Sec24D n=1 Tax=Perkinsus olseni TaxID=32597 RepID=A0A7J6SK20_PEROL|nr:hypothetical protein FOZ62_030569 [Perkinsus olseni]